MKLTHIASFLAPFVIVLLPEVTFAHGSEASIVLLLPTGYYLLGAALAVAASFVLLVFLPEHLSSRLAAMRLSLARIPVLPHAATSLVSFAILLFLVLAGIYGTRDPVENPLPLVIWMVWWVCFTLLQGLVGPLWPHLNPWTGPLALIRKAIGLGIKPLLRLPRNAGYLIAVLQFALFAWFELIDLAPSDPGRLAIAVSLYWLFNFVGAILCGEEAWFERAEPFSIFFGLIGRLSPLDRKPVDESHIELGLVWPGRSLLDRSALPLIAVLFVLLTLSTVGFDGFSRTFLWLSAIGINPLEFPGRSAVVISGTLGMLGMFAVQSTLFFGAVAVGAAIAGRGDLWRDAAGRLIYSIVPIALAFQAAHYLTTVLVDGQNVLIALSDPFALGWNLFGSAHWHTTTSFLNTLDGVSLIFNSETAIITLGHVVGIVMAHLIALKVFGNSRSAVVSQIPLAVLMVAYTAFGLWLLSTPRI
jgi:hypothetical protein